MRGLESGSIVPGERLPSARSVQRDQGVDHRNVLAAYRQLAEEGLVETRTRGGTYVSAHQVVAGAPRLPESWFVDVMVDGIAREIPPSELHHWLRKTTETLRLRAIVIAGTADEAVQVCHELRDDFGIEWASILTVDVTARPVDAEVRRADLLVATATHQLAATALGEEAGKPVIIIKVRREVVGGDRTPGRQRPSPSRTIAVDSARDILRFIVRANGAALAHAGRPSHSTQPTGPVHDIEALGKLNRESSPAGPDER